MDVYDAPQQHQLPDLVLEIIFSSLKLCDLYSCMLVCRNWNRVINGGRSQPWKSVCRRELPERLLNSHHLSPLPSHKDKLRALHNSWNPRDCSANLVVENHGFTFVHRYMADPMDTFGSGYIVIVNRNTFPHHPTGGGHTIWSTDMVRTKTGHTTGKHVWEIKWRGLLGEHTMIGVSTKEAPLHCDGCRPLLGANKHGWGWNMASNVLLHNATPHGNYPLLKNAPKHKFGDKLLLVLDCDNGTLHFEKCNTFLGIAFKNLPKTKLYPSVSVPYGNTNVTILYTGNTGSVRRRTRQTQF